MHVVLANQKCQSGEPAPVVAPPLETSSPDWFADLQAVLFWIVATIVIFFLLRIVWRDRRELGSDKIWQAFLEWWRSIWSWILRWKNRVAIQLRRRASRTAESAAEAGSSWWERWRARTARERVRRLYLAMLNGRRKSERRANVIRLPTNMLPGCCHALRMRPKRCIS